ncbi:MAG TPA: GAF domain-containing protein, partial [Thermoanaerobaculia bacterium]|nr:GAF domain-containing protein [Thermoanaerobaculia bacterium]
ARIVLGFLAVSYRRAALFQVARDKVTAWMAQGEVDLDKFGQFTVSLDKPSVFLNLRHGQSFYVGPLPPMPAHRELAQAWGGELPRDCAVLPVRLKDRLVAVIYADGAKKGLGGIDLTQLQGLAASTAAALQRGILHKKKGEAGA